METTMQTSDFFFELPPELIAQTPLDKRDDSRLLVLDKKTGAVTGRRFFDLPELLSPGDLLVLNDSRVLPARLLGQKIPTGGAMEFLLLEAKGDDTWEILVRPGRKAAVGSRFSFGNGLLIGEIIAILEEGNRLVKFSYEGNFYAVLDEIGNMPLPPYITESLQDKERYQTVYAREQGSAAAPTAGLHFTPELLQRLTEAGIDTAFVTLHVGLGTFRPVKARAITEHKMHGEHYQIPAITAEKIAQTKAAGGRVIAVGTTSCRTLESVVRDKGAVVPCTGFTDIFIYPGYRFGGIDGLITNFHLPESTLIMLVSAFGGYDNVMKAYQTAVAEQYRFFSFGDSMMIL